MRPCTPAHRAGGPPRPLGPPAPPPPWPPAPHREYGFHDFRPRPYHPAPPREGYGYAGPGPHLYQPHRSIIRHSRAGSAPGSAPLGLITKESSISSQPIRSLLPQLEWSGRPQLAPDWPHARAPPGVQGYDYAAGYRTPWARAKCQCPCAPVPLHNCTSTTSSCVYMCNISYQTPRHPRATSAPSGPIISDYQPITADYPLQPPAIP